MKLKMPQEIENKTSMFWWYPRIKDLPIPQPRTGMYRFTEEEYLATLEERYMETITNSIRPLAEALGYPLFMRTDFSSCKHGWEKTCYVEGPEGLFRHIAELLSDSGMQGFMSYQDNGIVLREFIPLETSFTAFRGNMPINKERRYFVRDGEIQCHHPYWYPGAIEGHTKQDNWRELVAELNTETEQEVDLLSEYARVVSRVIPGYWSVDFAKAKDGKWYLFDMAEGEKSFHWLECEHCPQSMRDRYAPKERCTLFDGIDLDEGRKSKS